MVPESLPEEVALELRPEGGEGAWNSKGEGKRKEVGAWEMKLEAKRRGPAGLGRSLRRRGGEVGERPARRQPHPASGEEEAPGRLQAAAASGYPAGGQPREEGGQGVGTWPPWARPEVPAARTAPSSARRRGRQVGERGLCPEGPGSLCPANLFFSLPFFNRAGVGPL